MSRAPRNPPSAGQNAIFSDPRTMPPSFQGAMGGLPAWPDAAAGDRPGVAAELDGVQLAAVHAAINRLLPPDGAGLVYLPTSVTPEEAFTAIGRLREEARDEIDRLFAFLDATEGDPDREEGGDAEPSLGWTTGGATGAGDDREGDGPVGAPKPRRARSIRTGEGRRHG